MSNDLRIIEALKEADIDYDKEGYNEVKSFKDNGIDSLDVMNLFLVIEEKYGVKFSEKEADSINTPIGISSALDEKIN